MGSKTKKGEGNLRRWLRMRKDFPWLWAICQDWYNSVEVEVEVRLATESDMNFSAHPDSWYKDKRYKYEVWFKENYTNCLTDRIFPYEVPLGDPSLRHLIYWSQNSSPNTSLKFVILVKYAWGSLAKITILRPPKGQKSF